MAAKLIKRRKQFSKPPKLTKKRMTIKTLKQARGRTNVRTGQYEGDTLLAMMNRAWDMHCIGFYDREVADELFNEFKLEKRPDIATVRSWWEMARMFTTDQIKKHQEEFINKSLGIMNMMLKKWAQIALLPNLQISRTKMVDGEAVEVIDQNAYDEQIKAGTLVVKLLKEGRDIMGVGNQGANIDMEGIDQKTMLNLVMQVNTFIQNPNQQPNGKAIDIEGTKLELESGVPEIDAL